MALTEIAVDMAKALAEYDQEAPIYPIIGNHIQVMWNQANAAYRNMMGEYGIVRKAQVYGQEIRRLEQQLKNARWEIEQYKTRLDSASAEALCAEYYRRGVTDAKRTKTYLAGRVIMWIPKQLSACARSVKQFGVKQTIVKIRRKFACLPQRISEILR